jgi:hypothetical protein
MMALDFIERACFHGKEQTLRISPADFVEHWAQRSVRKSPQRLWRS